MAKNSSVIIGDHFADFIERQVSEGRYGSASDVVRAGLRLLEEREMKVEALRAALAEGEQSGASTAFDFDAFVTRKRRSKRREKGGAMSRYVLSPRAQQDLGEIRVQRSAHVSVL